MAGGASGQVMVSDKAASSTIARSSEALMHSSSLVRSSLSDSLWKLPTYLLELQSMVQEQRWLDAILTLARQAGTALPRGHLFMGVAILDSLELLLETPENIH